MKRPTHLLRHCTILVLVSTFEFSPHKSYSSALTITTFNILAPVHRSMDASSRRESEREMWWRPRAEGVAQYIADKFVSSDVIMLQEWWFDETFTQVFDDATGHLFHRIAERRPSAVRGEMRDDGLCCLIRKDGVLEPIRSWQVSTGPTRISQLVHCRESRGSEGRDVYLANSHLSFPGDSDPLVNEERQASEAKIILDALSAAAEQFETNNNNSRESLHIICGDFNSNSCGLAASLCESHPYNFVNCASATAQQMLANIGGPINIGVTHCNHLGEQVSVDHIFLRLNKNCRNSIPTQTNRCTALAMGYLDTKGTRIVNVQKEDIVIEGKQVLSDHRPVTVSIHWPSVRKSLNETFESDLYVNVSMPLDPLESPWGIV
eukprot:scaffold37692_cov60-Cyclotella_meneghiniana.AAC.8